MVSNENTVSLSLRSFGLGVKFFISYFACGYPLMMMMIVAES